VVDGDLRRHRLHGREAVDALGRAGEDPGQRQEHAQERSDRDLQGRMAVARDMQQVVAAEAVVVPEGLAGRRGHDQSS